VVHRCFVIWTWLLQHVVEHPRTSRGQSRAPSSRVHNKGLGVVAAASLLERLAARLLPFLAPLILPMGLPGLAALCRRVVRALALLAVEDPPRSWWRCRTARSSPPAGCAPTRARGPDTWCPRGRHAQFRIVPRLGAPCSAWRSAV
jgi:hypothetical protein